MRQRSGFGLIQDIHQNLRCEDCVANKMLDLPSKRRSSVRETQMGYFFTNRMTDSELMTVFNFVDCKSGCSSACAVDKGPGDCLVNAVCKGMEFCGRKRVVLRTDSERAVPVLSTASTGPIEVADRLVEGQIRTTRGRPSRCERSRSTSRIQSFCGLLDTSFCC